MKNTIKTNLKAIIKGTTCQGKPFEEEVTFTLILPKNDDHYGTGCYMKANGDHWDQYIDVRYEKTKDIEELAKRFIKGYYGKNAEEVTII